MKYRDIRLKDVIKYYEETVLKDFIKELDRSEDAQRTRKSKFNPLTGEVNHENIIPKVNLGLNPEHFMYNVIKGIQSDSGVCNFYSERAESIIVEFLIDNLQDFANAISNHDNFGFTVPLPSFLFSYLESNRKNLDELDELNEFAFNNIIKVKTKTTSMYNLGEFNINNLYKIFNCNINKRRLLLEKNYVENLYYNRGTDNNNIFDEINEGEVIFFPYTMSFVEVVNPYSFTPKIMCSFRMATEQRNEDYKYINFACD